MGQTLSFSVGHVAPLHDVRQELSENVDPTLSHNNMTLIDKLADFDYDIEAYTNARFQPVLDAYNAKQTRADRRKNKPYVELVKEENAKRIATAQKYKEQGINKTVRKPTELVREYVVQIGDHESNGTLTCDMTKNQQFAREFVEEFQKKNPHVEILLATFHGDEPNGTPHIHILTQFVGEGYAQGLSQQISTSKALECDGVSRATSRSDDDGFALDRWIKRVKDETMEPLLHDIFHEERLELNESREHIPTPVFRRKAKEEQKYIDEKYEELLQTRDNLVEYRNQLIQAKKNIETRESTLETEKAEFEAYRASETQKIQELEHKAELNVKNTESNLQHSRRMFQKGHDSMDRASEAWDVIVEARKLPEPQPERASRMTSFMGKYTMKDGRSLYQHYLDAEPKMIQTEKENALMFAELDRKFGTIKQSFDNDYGMDF